MPKFSRDTIVKLIEALHFRTNDQVLRFDLRFGLDLEYSGGIEPKETAIMRYLVDNPDATGPMGGSLVVEIIEDIIQRDLEAPERTWGLSGGAESFEDRYPELARSLKRDGYVVEGGKLKTMLPEELQLPVRENELVTLLGCFGFSTTKGHYDEAVSAHTRGQWAAANGQMRTFIESMFDEIAGRLVGGKAHLPTTSHARRELLARLNPPFLLSDLNEWEIGGKGGFVQGVWRRLHAEGPHPGLSGDEDSTFRLHLVILVASHYLRRLRDRSD